MASSFPWHAFPLLLRPSKVAARLAEMAQHAPVEPMPNLWQIELGVLRMWHRMVTRPDSVGLTVDHPVRPTWRARLFEWRPLRFPFVLAHGSVRPWDLSGLLSSTDEVMQHLLGTHHDGLQFVYDLQILAATPGALERLRDKAQAVVDGADPHAAWRRDLCVFEQYHEALLATVERVIAEGVELPEDAAADPDISFYAYLRWCADQPATAAETWRAWRAGTFAFDKPLAMPHAA